MSEEGFDVPAALAPAELPAYAAEPQNTATLRWASAAYHSASGDTPASTGWQPRILEEVEVGISAADALGVGGRLGLGVTSIALADADGALRDLVDYGLADGRNVLIRTVPVEEPNASDFGTPLAGRAIWMRSDFRAGTHEIARTDPTIAFRGMTRAVNRTGERRGEIILSDVMERLAVPLQATLYQGTGGIEGGSELKGKPKPVALGRVFNIEPVYLGNVDLGVGIGALPTFQVHWRSCEEVAEVRIRGVAQALTGGTPTVGQARAFAALGMFQLGSTPDGDVRVDVRGDNVGGYVSSTALVMRRLLLTHGPGLSVSDLDATAFAFAETDLPGEIGAFRGAITGTAADLAQDIVAANGAILCGGRGGTIRLFDPIARDSTVQFALPVPWLLACRPLALPSAIRPLPRAVAVNWRRNWAPVTDIAASIATGERERFTNANSGPERAESTIITARVAVQRELAFDGLYWAQADAAARAAAWRTWLEHGPRVFEVVTDRYLGVIDCGAIGRLTYPAHGLDAGVRVVVLGWREQLAARRVTLTLATLPEA